MQQTEKNANKRHGAFSHRVKSLEANEQLWKSLGVCEELSVTGGNWYRTKAVITLTGTKTATATTIGITAITAAGGTKTATATGGITAITAAGDLPCGNVPILVGPVIHPNWVVGAVVGVG